MAKCGHQWVPVGLRRLDNDSFTFDSLLCELCGFVRTDPVTKDDTIYLYEWDLEVLNG